MRYAKFAIFLCILCISVVITTPQHVIKHKVTHLRPGSVVTSASSPSGEGFFKRHLQIYCYEGLSKSVRSLLESVEVLLEIENDDFTQYKGVTPDEVYKHYNDQQSMFSFSLFSQKQTRMSLCPFSPQCIGIETLQPYRIHLRQQRVDLWRFLQLSVGVLLFTYSSQLSHNAIFYYITGVTFGICSSFMLLIWFASKLLPRRGMMYGALLGGWTIGLYFVQLLCENIQTIILTYRTYVFWYILTTGIISFFFCYRFGPPQNKRSKDIVKWLLQLISLLMVYLTSYYEEATSALCIIMLIVYYFPRSVIHKVRAVYMRRFPPKRRLLTNEEYYEQGARETTKALEELRKFASSPDCKQWKVMSKLSDPRRFASFVEGASHLRDEEILQFEDCANYSPDRYRLSAYNNQNVSEDEDVGLVNNWSTPPLSRLHVRLRNLSHESVDN